MIVSIRIENYALIDSLELTLEGGLSIITGETGAGKSILLGALGLLLGKRADTSVLKDGSRKCIVEGVFNIKDYKLEEFFNSQDLDYCDETVIRREISGSGKSRAFINDTPVNLTTLQEFTILLIDIHSQHHNLLLNNAHYIRWIVDAYAGLTEQARIYQTHYNHYSILRNQYYREREAYRENQRNQDYLTHQFEELTAANLKPDELPELERHADTLEHASEIKTALESASYYLNNDEHGVIGSVKQVLNQLEHIQKHLPGARDLLERIQQTYIELKDIDSDMVNQSLDIEVDPAQLGNIMSRIDELNTLLHKHKCETVEDLISLRDQYDEMLKKFADGDYELDKLKAEVDKKEKMLTQQARELSDKRTASFIGFEDQVKTLLLNLGIKDGIFQVKHRVTDLSSSGIDDIQFYFSANKNVPPQNVSKVASGGELSRLMLAVKYLISGTSGLPTIIFDEIDTGVSGEIADKVGNLVKEMSTGMQVINITHLPQVAGKGNHHYKVYKENLKGDTQTFIKKLTHDERLHEIAGMLSGDKVTEAALANAHVLLKS